MKDLITEVNIPMETVTEITDNGPKDRGAQGVPRLCAGQDGHDRRDAGTWCGTSAASPALWAPPTRPSPSPTTRSPPLGVENARRSWSTTRWATTSRSPTAPWTSFIGTVENDLDRGQEPRHVVGVHVRPGDRRSSWNWIRWNGPGIPDLRQAPPSAASVGGAAPRWRPVTTTF